MIAFAFQTIFTSLLVGLMLLGNAAAWIHRGTCNDVQCRVSKLEEKSRCGSTHCCHSHRAASPLDAISLRASESGNHDSSHCAACYSATTGGMTALLGAVVSCDCVASIVSAFLAAEITLQAVSLEQLHLRGPPVLFV